MEYAFWDSSALVPLCITQRSTPQAKALSANYGMAVWWLTAVEIRSAFARELRMGQLTPNGLVQAQITLDRLRDNWREQEPTEAVREQAERLIDRFPLKAADALQLAAAMGWCLKRPTGRPFISGDGQLLESARALGFLTIQA